MDVKKYILDLELVDLATQKRVKIINSKVKTGFRGFIVNIISITAMYQEYVEQNHWMSFFPTYRISQDHLEMLFGKIRTLNGYNDNPNAQQFCSAYRKLLYESDVVLSAGSNIESRGYSNVLTVSSSAQSSSQKDGKSHHVQFEDQLDENSAMLQF